MPCVAFLISHDRPQASSRADERGIAGLISFAAQNALNDQPGGSEAGLNT
jgi:hypothetical protein